MEPKAAVDGPGGGRGTEEANVTAQASSGKNPAPQMVTTNTGRILRINPEDAHISATAPSAQTAAARRTGIATDPARRSDVLFRVRRDEGHEISAWWMIGAFVVTSGLVIALLSWVPGNA